MGWRGTGSHGPLLSCDHGGQARQLIEGSSLTGKLGWGQGGSMRWQRTGSYGPLLGCDHGSQACQLSKGSSLTGKLGRGQGGGIPWPDSSRAGCVAAIPV